MKPLKTLIIEDDEVTRNEIAELLTKEDLDVIQAADGNEGRDLFDKESPDVVITDLRMPGLTGLEILEYIHKDKPLVPVILVTAFGETEVAVQAIRLGAFDYIKKPIDLEDLFMAIGRAKELIAEIKEYKEFPNIMIAEDDTVSRNSLAGVLEKEDLNVLQANNGAEAVEIFKSNKIDIVLLDIKMPKMDGLQALRHMRELNDDFEAIILTGYGDEEAAIEALRQGAISFIRKPIDIEEVLTLVEKAQEKLLLHRSLKYRTREVSLANQIIAQISANEEIQVRLSDEMLRKTRDHASNILNHIQDGVILVDSEMRIRYANKVVEDALPDLSIAVDDAFSENLFGKLNPESGDVELTQIITKVFSDEFGQISPIEKGGAQLGIATKVKLEVNKTTNEYVFLLIRNEA